MVQELCKGYLWGGSAEEEVGGWQFLVVLLLKNNKINVRHFVIMNLLQYLRVENMLSAKYTTI